LEAFFFFQSTTAQMAIKSAPRTPPITAPTIVVTAVFPEGLEVKASIGCSEIDVLNSSPLVGKLPVEFVTE